MFEALYIATLVVEHLMAMLRTVAAAVCRRCHIARVCRGLAVEVVAKVAALVRVRGELIASLVCDACVGEVSCEVAMLSLKQQGRLLLPVGGAVKRGLWYYARKGAFVAIELFNGVVDMDVALTKSEQMRSLLDCILSIIL